MAYNLEFEKTWIKSVSKENSKKKNDHHVSGVNGEEIKVAVIGAGVSGLCVLKHIISKKGKFHPTVFEKGSKIGGVWVYNDHVTDEYGVPTHSPFYKNLRTNSPKPLMTFPGFPHVDQKNSFMSHDYVLRYIEDFSDYYQLLEHRYIQFNTMVTAVHPIHQNDSKVKWKVTYCNMKDNQTSSRDFDAVLVCNGHFSKPYIPEVIGIKVFTGNIIHSRDYRIPESYEGKAVLVIGASHSGLDIAVDIATTAKQVFLSHRHELLKTNLPINVRQRKCVHHLDRKSVIFVDETEEEIDAIIFCTGYHYDFPFLSTDIVQIEDQRVMPLYKHMLHIKYHNLIFIGIPKLMSLFAQIHEQARVAVTILEGEIQLPSDEEMKRDADEDYRHRIEDLGMKKKDAHLLSICDLQWKFNEDLASLGRFPTLPKILKFMNDHLKYCRKTDFLSFRKTEYRLLNSTSFAVVNKGSV